MKKLIVIAAAMLLACATSFAQLNVNLGYVNSVESYRTSSEKISMRLNGFTVGLGYSLELADDFYFTPGVNYIFAGAPDTYLLGGGPLNLKGKVTEHYINAPLMLSYDFDLASNTKLFVFLGPTASYGIASNTKFTASVAGYKADETLNNYADKDYKRFDIMIGGGAGLKISDRYLFRVGFDYGLINRSTTKGINEHHRMLTVGIAYLFD